MVGRSSEKPKFEKILFRAQPYPDNYTCQKTFLNSLIRNKNLHIYSFNECAFYGQLPLQQICGTIIFILLHVLNIDVTDAMLVVVAMVTAIFYLTIAGSSRNEAKTCILFGGFLFGLSPIIQTLTQTISSDTIYTVVALCLLLNFTLQNYSLSKGDYMSNCVSLNAAIFAAVCLASRLDNLNAVTATIVHAIVIYGLVPRVRLRIASRCPQYLICLTVAMVMACCGLAMFLPHWRVVIVAVVISSGVCVLIVPLVFVHLQKLKDNIYGPWDEAELIGICHDGRDLTSE